MRSHDLATSDYKTEILPLKLILQKLFKTKERFELSSQGYNPRRFTRRKVPLRTMETMCNLSYTLCGIHSHLRYLVLKLVIDEGLEPPLFSM